MRVLHIGEYVSGGVATYLKVLMKYSKKHNIDCYLLMSEYKSEKDWDVKYGKIFKFKYKRNIIHIFLMIKTIQKYIEYIKPDVIHVHSSWAGMFVRLPYLIKRKPCGIIYTPHGWSFLMDTSIFKKRIYAFMEKVLMRVTNAIINISNYEKEEAEKFGVDSKNIEVIYNGVDEANEINPNNLMEKGKIKLLFVGRLDKTKGLDLFLNVYNRYRFPDIHLYVIGEGILDSYQYKDGETITYLGWINNEIVDSYYKECDAVIIPSRWEGFGLTAIEAMRNRKAIIASNRGALPEIVGDCGYIFDLDIENELRFILENLEKEELKRIGEKGFFRYKKMFTSEIFSHKTIEVEKRCIEV